MAETVLRLDSRPSDASLVASAREGNAAAQEALFRRHVTLATGVAYRILGADDEVDDVVQESFATVLSTLSRLKDPQAFASWLASIVTRTAIGRLRRAHLLRRLGLRGIGVSRPEGLISPTAPADVMLELRAVYELIQRLPTDDRVMLILHRVEELTLDQVAERTGWSVATVKRRLARVEAALLAYMDGGRTEP